MGDSFYYYMRCAGWPRHPIRMVKILWQHHTVRKRVRAELNRTVDRLINEPQFYRMEGETDGAFKDRIQAHLYKRVESAIMNKGDK